jgi:ketosteroid isomerase-like protein
MAAKKKHGADERTIRALDKTWGDDASSGNLVGVLACYARDGSLVWPGSPAFRGSAAIRRAWTKLIRTPGLELRFTPKRIDISDDGTLASDFGVVTMVMDAPKGKSKQVAKYLVVWKKVGEEWKVLYDSYNMNTEDSPPTG